MTKKEKAACDWTNNHDGVKMDSIILQTIPVYPRNLKQATFGNDGGGLPERFKEAGVFEQRVWDWLCNCPYIQTVTPTGFEHVIPDRQFRHCLRRVVSPLVDQYRYSPDFLTLSRYGQLVYIEAKRSLNIEREAYIHYMQLNSTTPVWLIIEAGGETYWQRISSIEFLDSRGYVSQFPNPFKVNDDDWILPRGSNEHSSCPYKVIDLCCMEPLDMEGED